MSSLQKFHRRTNGGAPPFGGFTTLGSGNNTVGYWLGDIATNRLVIAPQSTEIFTPWGSKGTFRGNAGSYTNGIANTNVLAGFGNSITTGHPAAYYCKNLTTGGYNTWYLPAKNELTTLHSNMSATPFATANSFATTPLYGNYYWASTETDLNRAWAMALLSGGSQPGQKYTGWTGGGYWVRAVRRSAI